MSLWLNLTQMSSISTSARWHWQITPEWQQWIAENLLMGKDSRPIAEAMNRDGFDLETAIGEICEGSRPPLHRGGLGRWGWSGPILR